MAVKHRRALRNAKSVGLFDTRLRSSEAAGVKRNTNAGLSRDVAVNGRKLRLRSRGKEYRQ